MPLKLTWIIFLLSTTALAQPAPDSIRLDSTSRLLREVTVTTNKRQEWLKENPMAVALVTAAMIDRSMENNVVDALAKNTPGVQTLKTGPNISKPFIRGLGYTRVLTLVDGIRQEGQQWGGEHGLEIDSYNIHQAEIVKGAAGLMYGSDAMAGVVSLLSPVPKENDGKIHEQWISEYQSNHGLIGNGFRLQRGNPHWLWSIRGSYRAARNYRNAVDGWVYNTGFRETNVSALVGYKSKTGFIHANFSWYDNLQGIPDGSRDSLTRKFTRQVNDGALDDIRHRPMVPESALRSYDLSPLHQHIQHYRAYLRGQQQLGKKGTLQSSLAFTRNVRREYIHPAAPFQPGTYYVLQSALMATRYDVPIGSAFHATVGANAMLQQNTVPSAASTFAIPNYDLFDGGGFFVGKLTAGDWTVVGGARVDTRRITTQTMFVGTDPSTGFDRQVLLPDTSGARRQFTSFTRRFNGVALSLGSAYTINDWLTWKMNVAHGYRAPSVSEMASNGLDAGAHLVYLGNPNFKSETSWQEDVTMMIALPALTAEVSLFNTHFQNFIYLNQVTDATGVPIRDAQGNHTIQYQQASAQLYGLEASLAFRPKQLPGFSINTQLALCYGFNRAPQFEQQKQQGEYLPLIPPARWMTSVHYETKFRKSWLEAAEWFVEADVNGAQNRYLALFNTETRTTGYTLMNVGGSLKIREHWRLQLQVNNIFDTVYQSHLSRLKYAEYFSSSLDGRSGIYGMGRNIALKVMVTF